MSKNFAETTNGLPSNVLITSSSSIGGVGLSQSTERMAIASEKCNCLAEVICYGVRASEIARKKILNLNYSPIRLLSALTFLPKNSYHGLKKRHLDFIASLKLRSGKFDFLHSWSGDCLRSLIVAKINHIPSMIEIPTWHRNKGKVKNFITKTERELLADKSLSAYIKRLEINRQRILTEYQLADLLLVQSEASAESFIKSGISAEKLFFVGRGADLPDLQKSTNLNKSNKKFRFIYVGTLSKRKGAHLVLEAWITSRLAETKDTELILAGDIRAEIQPYIEKFPAENLKLPGFCQNIQAEMLKANAFVFPSSLEGGAKALHEAAACGLPLISTREAGDVLTDGKNGILIQAGKIGELASAMQKLYRDQKLARAMGQKSREIIEQNYTWEHYYQRIGTAYRQAKLRCQKFRERKKL